ncbi:MAG: hypothetical protein M3437_06250 [Chloroflexota bacterium]|nr:hypothetical protein [Chloroflexota bacterium]MDQ5866054.1 hypothetical protein [Chloroflexota bacterium]
MGFRFMQWQQMVLIVAPFVLLLAYIAWVSIRVRGRGFVSASLRLVAAAAAFSGIWAISAYFLWGVAWRGTSDVTADYSLRISTFNASIGLPFSLFREQFLRLQELGWPSLLTRMLPTYAGLLLLGGVVAVTQRLLANTRFAVEQHGSLYMRWLAGIAMGVLVVLLWPQPGRNPVMPSVPIPDDAVGVTYTRTPDEHQWPMTTFTVNGGVGSMLAYYQEALQASGWTLEYSERDYRPSGHAYGKALLSRAGEVLEVSLAYGHETYVRIVKHPATSAELAALAALPKPTATPTRDPNPAPAAAPVQTRLVIRPVPSQYTLPPIPTAQVRR